MARTNDSSMRNGQPLDARLTTATPLPGDRPPNHHKQITRHLCSCYNEIHSLDSSVCLFHFVGEFDLSYVILPPSYVIKSINVDSHLNMI